MTLGQAVETVELFLGDKINAESFDFTTMAMYVNKALREVQSKLMPYKEWAYISTVKITSNPMSLTLDVNNGESFIDAVTVMLPYHHPPTSSKPNGYDTYVEARRCSGKEFFGLTDRDHAHKWNLASFSSPVYCIWGGIDLPVRAEFSEWQPTDGLMIYLAPYKPTVFNNKILGEGYEFPVDGPFGYLDCLLTPRNYTQPSDILNIPVEYEDLMIIGAMARVVNKMADLDKLTSSFVAINEAYSTAWRSVNDKIIGEKISLESLDNPRPQTRGNNA